MTDIRKQTKLWTMRDGRKIRICDMGDEHLVNAIRMVERNSESRRQHALSAGYQMECMLQGEMALMCIEREICAMEEDPDMFLPGIFQNLCLEASRRGLETEQEVTA